MTDLTQGEILVFKAISDFVIELSSIFGNKKEHKSLLLYNRLIRKTKLFSSNKTPIRKHINTFTDFCIRNRIAIIQKNKNLIGVEAVVSDTVVSDTVVSDTVVSDTVVSDAVVSDAVVSDAVVSDTVVSDTVVSDTVVSDAVVSDVSSFLIIQYSERVYIDIKSILKLSDEQTCDAIWNHLLTISAFVDPAGNAKEILKANLKSTNGDNINENMFLENIISQVEKSIPPNGSGDADPMKMISSIMQSGVFTDLIGGMNQGLSNGSLDIGKLMGTVQGLIGGMNNIPGGDGGGENPMMNMMNMMMSGMGNVNKSPELD